MPGMFIEASNKHNLDLKNSYFISDTAKDLSVSKKIDINIALVETGYGSLQDMNTNTKYLKAKNLYEAVKKILKNSND